MAKRTTMTAASSRCKAMLSSSPSATASISWAFWPSHRLIQRATIRQLWLARSTNGAELGARQHQRIWRKSCNVTLGGQSAGAEDTGLNMLSPLASGLFQRGICESFCPAGNLQPCLLQKRSAPNSRCRRLRQQERRGSGELPARSQRGAGRIAGGNSERGKQVRRRHNAGWYNSARAAANRVGKRPIHAYALMNGNVADEEDFGLAITEYFSKPRQPATKRSI